MDLHDYEIVAENYDLYMGTLGQDNHEKFTKFYFNLCEQHNSKNVMDLACGTGLLSIPLVEKGIKVTAVDISQKMLDVLKSKNKNSSLIRIENQNMIDLEINDLYSMIIIARSGFMHLLTPDDQRKALININ